MGFSLRETWDFPRDSNGWKSGVKTHLAYILAASHSGSTLLAMLLAAHPEACTVGELKANHLGDLDRYRCSCGEPIKQCGFWALVTAAMKRKGFDFDVSAMGTDFQKIESAYSRALLRPLCRGPALELVRDAALALSPLWRGHKKRVLGRTSALLEVLHEITGAKVIIDSSKIGLRLKYLVQENAIETKVIRLIRDGRGVALAHMDPLRYADASNPCLRAGGFGGNRDEEMRSTKAAAHEWRRSNEEAEALLKRIGKARWMVVRYEDLCAAPEKVLRGICAFLDISPDGITRDFRAVKQHVIGNGMRLDSSSSIQLDERWRASLTPEDLRIFDEVAGELNRKYGYV